MKINHFTKQKLSRSFSYSIAFGIFVKKADVTEKRIVDTIKIN